MSCSIAATPMAGGSTSVVSAETKTETGWHVFKVQGYSQYRAAACVGQVVESGAFAVGGRSWRVLYIPCGYPASDVDSGWVGFGLRLVSRRGVTAQFTLRLLDKDGAPSPLYRGASSRVRHFSGTGRRHQWYFGRFIRRDAFDSLYLEADCFRVRCDVTVVPEARDDEPPPPDLHRHLGNMLDTGVGGDVTFDVAGETFVAHRNVLAARSPVFMAEFFGGVTEEKQATAARVRILGIDARAFKAMLHFIYTDSLPEIEEDDKNKMAMAQHLLVAADRYGMERLKLFCEKKLCSFVDASVAATTLVLAEHHGCRRLKEACFKLLKVFDNFKALGYNDYNYLRRSCPDVLDELLAEHGK